MKSPAGFDHCLTFINCQLSPKTKFGPNTAGAGLPRAVTISRQCGSGALVVAKKLAERLQAHSPRGAPPWTVFDRNLMEKVLEDHQLPRCLAKYLPEDRISEVQDIMDDLFGVHPPSWTIVPQVAETMLHLVELGNVILVGRGATVVTAKVREVFHVRLVAPLEQRLAHAHEFYGMPLKAAREFVLKEDRGRRRYLRKHFGADANDPLFYHMILNTGLMTYDEAARAIAEAMFEKAQVHLAGAEAA